MDPALATALASLANNPSMPAIIIFCTVLGYWLFNRGIIVPGAISELLIEQAKLRAEGEACKARNDDLLARVKALEAQIEIHLRAS
jgi:hypothetical protein